jgi:hypothetical protein
MCLPTADRLADGELEPTDGALRAVSTWNKIQNELMLIEIILSNPWFLYQSLYIEKIKCSIEIR